MRLSARTARTITIIKIVGVPLLMLSFFNPIDMWSALGDVILNNDIKLSTRALVGSLYGIVFATLLVTAWKGLHIIGFGLFTILTGVVTYWLYDTGKISFTSVESFGWYGLVIAIVIGYVAVFGANFYRLLTGRISADSDDADT